MILTASPGHTTAQRVILITGAGRGIGEALALEYAEAGVCLVLVGRSADDLQRVAQTCRTKGAEVKVMQADVTRTDELRQKLFKLDDEMPVDLLIANAGVTSGLETGQLVEAWDGVKTVAQTNFLGVMATVSPICDRMVARRQGQIAVMGSLSAYRGLPSCPAYSGAKAGVETYAMALRDGLAPSNVWVNVVSPGYVKTDMSDKLDGPKPFLLSSKQAASIIRRGLARNRARISFPFPLNFGARVLSLLPDRLARVILSFCSFTVQR